MFGPILRGERCVLRPPRKDELSVYRSWFADMEVTRYILRTTPLSEAQEEEWFTRTAEAQDRVAWIIEVDGKPVGTTGIGVIDWLNRHGTTGIVIGEKRLWRRGIASEVMALRTRYAFRELNLQKLKTEAFTENEASRRALMKTGYRESGIFHQELFRDGSWHDLWEGELLREDWEKIQPT